MMIVRKRRRIEVRLDEARGEFLDRALARRLAAVARATVVVGAGLHYEAASGAEIATAVALAERLVAQAAAWLAGRQDG